MKLDINVNGWNALACRSGDQRPNNLLRFSETREPGQHSRAPAIFSPCAPQARGHVLAFLTVEAGD